MSNLINLAQYVNDPVKFEKLRVKRLVSCRDDQPLYDHASALIEYQKDCDIYKAYKAELKAKRQAKKGA